MLGHPTRVGGTGTVREARGERTMTLVRRLRPGPRSPAAVLLPEMFRR